MSAISRLWERMNGVPHRYDKSQQVSDAADALSDNVRELSSHLRPYMEADDPMVALMIDLFNQRQMNDVL